MGLTYEILGVVGQVSPCQLGREIRGAIKTPIHLFPIPIQTYFTYNVHKKTLSSIGVLVMFDSEELGVALTR